MVDREFDPKDLAKRLESFFSQHTSAIEILPRVVVVTSGGTRVNMDIFGIRFIDNFSTGRRGSEMAEYFLKNGCLVVFLARKNSHLPFMRSLLNIDNPYQLLESLDVDVDGSLTMHGGDDFKDHVLKDVDSYKEHNSKLFVEYFTTVFEYSDKFKAVVQYCRRFEENVSYVLAAAVSDFKLSDDSLATEKLSSKHPLDFTLEPLPKMRNLVRDLADSRPMLCCFKMSTDQDDMERSAKKMLSEPTLADMVVCNIFDERMSKVSVVHSDGSSKLFEDTPSEINRLIAQEVLNTHSKKMVLLK